MAMSFFGVKKVFVIPFPSLSTQLKKYYFQLQFKNRVLKGGHKPENPWSITHVRFTKFL